MDVKNYMNEDLKFIKSLIRELHQNITEWSTDKVLDKTDAMFHAFHKRFALEDFIFGQVKPTGVMKNSLEQFLKIRRTFQEKLEKILLLNVDEPDFLKNIGEMLKVISNHMLYLKTDFEPNFIDRVSVDQMARISANLEKEIRLLSFA